MTNDDRIQANDDLHDPEASTDDPAVVERLQHRLVAQRDALRRETAGEPGARVLELRASAAHLAALAQDEGYQRRLAADEAHRRRARVDELRARAIRIEVPEDEDVREVVLDDAAPETLALAALRAAVSWREGRRRGCVRVVGGPMGVGKTAALGHVLVRVEERARFVEAVTIGETPPNGYSANAAAWERWLTVPVLGVDDLGTERADTGDGEAIAKLLWRRYNRGLLTLVTTNLSRKPLAERYLAGAVGVRLADRLVNAQGRADADGRPGPGGLGWYVAAPGESLRNAAARAALIARGR